MNPNPSFEPQARLMLATAMAESVNFMLRRDYLDLLSAVPACGEGFSVLPGPACPDAPVWIEIRQVGVPARDARSFCADSWLILKKTGSGCSWASGSVPTGPSPPAGSSAT